MSARPHRRPGPVGLATVAGAAVAGLVCAASVGAADAAVPQPATHASSSHAVAHAAAAGTGSEEITLFLQAPHPAALARLAATPVTGPRAQRLHALQRLVPTSQDRSVVASTLARAGIHVERETAWSVTALAPSAVVSSLFGTRPATSTSLLPQVPAVLAHLVSAVYPTTAGPAAFRPQATSTLDGSDFRNADTPAEVAPSTGTHDAQNTVATLQLADFAPSDLTTYAKDNDLPDPIASGAYKTVKVDGGPSAMDDAGEGSVEVNLDQESILSTAPSAHQHAYFAPNTDAGFNDVFANVYDDVVGNKMATAPDPHLTALSSSWGECEGLYGAANIKALEPLIQSVVAAGVTVFASSGDDGIYDCRSLDMLGNDNSQADVDFPASSPYVVSTGGSNLSAPTNAPNTGTNWVEKTWTCATPEACQNGQTGTGGGGGGASGSALGHTYTETPSIGGSTGVSVTTTADFKGFAMPLWQRRTLTGVYAKSTTRLVPDIAADADPSTGFNVYTTLDTGATGTTLQVGGTSLASPISAAQLINTLGDAGRHHGVGDIHPALYSASARTAKLAKTSRKRPLRDITIGQIGATADKGKDPSTIAAKGYDTTSGVGGVLWSGMKPFLFDTAAPTPLARVAHRHATATFRWATRQGKDTLVINTTTVTIRRAGTHKALYVGHRRHGAKRLHVRRGRYTMTVRSTDIGGHARTVSKRLTVR